MISVTAAAHGFRRTSRSMGTHLKAFGSGRVALGSINEESENAGYSRYFTHKKSEPSENQFFSTVRRISLKFIHIFLRFLNALCPLVSLLVDVRSFGETKVVVKKTKRVKQNSIIDRMEDKVLLRIFSFCNAQTIISLESTCSRIYNLINKNCNDLAKIQKDQIKLHFDEGEVIIFPLDERRVPSRYAMPSIEFLANNLKHLSTQSLFIRGLIPVESIPVLKRLSCHPLSASQIYFLWCEFDDCSDEQLKNLFVSNMETLSDIGFEVCTPAKVVSDKLIEKNLPKLVSLRVWHENFVNTYAISDQTLFNLADLFKSNTGCPLETLDIAGGNFTVSGICALLHAWYNQTRPKNDIYISLHHSNFTQADVVYQASGIPLNFKRGLENQGFRLTLNIA